jgi:hypothetical protein
MATKANKEEYLGSPLAVPYKVFESDFKRALRQKAMVRDADNAVKNYKEVEAETARGQKKDSTPTVAEDNAANKAANELDDKPKTPTNYAMARATWLAITSP